MGNVFYIEYAGPIIILPLFYALSGETNTRKSKERRWRWECYTTEKESMKQPTSTCSVDIPCLSSACSSTATTIGFSLDLPTQMNSMYFPRAQLFNTCDGGTGCAMGCLLAVEL